MTATKKPTILVTGGAGYIGSCAALCLKEAGYPVVIIDNLGNGHRETIDALGLPFVQGDIGDSKLINEIVQKYSPQAVMHFAAHAYVGESVTNPAKYYLNNVGQSISFLSALVSAGIKTVVFSSTCATYGPVDKPISEDVAQVPINSYGRSKLMIEQLLKDFEHAYGVRYLAFRYFNVAGAHPSLLIGERHDPETHLLPRTIFATMGRPGLELFGTDYPTPDGTCIRDYVHVKDIASAHILGLEYLLSGGESCALNIGTGQGQSCLDVIKAVEKATGNKVPWTAHPRRAGDPPSLVAKADKIRQVLGWKPEFPGIDVIAESAVQWYKLHPEVVK